MPPESNTSIASARDAFEEAQKHADTAVSLLHYSNGSPPNNAAILQASQANAHATLALYYLARSRA